MTLQPTFEEQQLLADTRRRAGSSMTGRELLAELLVGAGFAAAVLALWGIAPPRSFAPLPAGLAMAVMVLATRVRFDTPFGFTVATQLAFVPLLFAVPRALAPVAVVLALTLARLPDVARGELKLSKLARMPANSWFAVGPALVFALAGVRPREAGPLVLVMALGAQFTGDFVASAVYFGIARRAKIRAQLGESWVYLIDAALSGVGLAIAEEIHAAPYAVLAMVPLLGLLAMFANERQGRLESLLELNDTYRGTSLLLGDVIAADDGYTGEHSQGVVGLALAVGHELRLGAERRRNLEFGALLHDVGKIAIPKEIINKPGQLDPHEWEIIKTHTVEGERMLRQVGGFMREVGTIVRSHHERWDGDGYPDGLRGETIPIESRIISCCDSWNAMRTDRSYRRAMPFARALAEVRDNAGTQFDPGVVRALVSIVSAEEAAAADSAVDETVGDPAPLPPSGGRRGGAGQAAASVSPSSSDV